MTTVHPPGDPKSQIAPVDIRFGSGRCSGSSFVKFGVGHRTHISDQLGNPFLKPMVSHVGDVILLRHLFGGSSNNFQHFLEYLEYSCLASRGNCPRDYVKWSPSDIY